jgi:glycosyltransferase involved in cell wall biosynthesis
VHRFTPSPVEDVSLLYDEGDREAAEQFDQIVGQVKPDVVHLHALTPAISLRTVRKARERDIPVILTVHIPGVFCPRGTLLRYGRAVCDGELVVNRCSRCVLESRGLPRPLAHLVGSVPTGVGAALANRQNGWTTAARMTHLIQMRRKVLRTVLSDLSHIVAVSEWVREALLRNGASPAKVTVCRQGMTQPSTAAGVMPVDRTAGGVRRIVYMGRIAPNKGVHTLIEAFGRSPHLALQLDIYGIVQDEHVYLDRLRALAAKDARIRFLRPVPNDTVIETLQSYDAVAVPSVWMESGPLTVYDAFAAGLPVIGSSLGGIAELVTDEQDGLLVEAEDVSAWASALERIANERGLVERLRRGIRSPRTMDMVAEEMLALYARCLSPREALT